MYFTKEGYLDIETLMSKDKEVYKFIIGGRGTGKTFGILKYMIDKARRTGLKFIYMRRTQTQVDMLKSADLNPFLAIENELGPSYRLIVKTINKSMSGVYEAKYEPKSQIYRAEGSPIGYIMALSTVANVRGMSAADVTDLFYDEFCPEKHEKPIKNEGRAFLNMIETFARNRELSGQTPLQVICASNSENLANPIFITLNFITPCEKALKRGVDHIHLAEQRASIWLLQETMISRAKRRTSLYQLAGDDSEFSKMSLSNQFTSDDLQNVRPEQLNEFKPLAQIGEICLYKHKARREWYVTSHVSGSPEVYDSSEIDIKRFNERFYYLKLAHMNRHIFFEKYVDKVLFENYMKI